MSETTLFKTKKYHIVFNNEVIFVALICLFVWVLYLKITRTG